MWAKWVHLESGVPLFLLFTSGKHILLGVTSASRNFRSKVDEVMRTRPHYIGEFQLQIRRHILPGTERRCTKKVLVESTNSENSDDSTLLTEYMSHFGQVVKVIFYGNPLECSNNSVNRLSHPRQLPSSS